VEIRKKSYLENKKKPKTKKGGKMKITKLVLLMLIVVFIISACAGKGSTKGVKEIWYPEWWNEQEDLHYIHTYGVATRLSETMALDTAANNAIFEAAKYVETRVKGMMKTFEEEAGVKDPQVLSLSSKVVKTLANATFTGSKVTEQKMIQVEVDGTVRYKCFVRYSVPKETINKNSLDHIKNEEALYNQFKASQAFGDLEAEIEKYDK